MLLQVRIDANTSNDDSVEEPFMKQERMHDSAHTIQVNSSPDGQSEQIGEFEKEDVPNWCCSLSCLFVGCITCVPLCPLYNVFKYRKLYRKRAIAEQNGEKFEISSYDECIFFTSLFFLIISVIWCILTIILCLDKHLCYEHIWQ